MLQILLLYLCNVFSSRRKKVKIKHESQPTLIAYNEYYYSKLGVKMKESLSISKCDYTDITHMLTTQNSQRKIERKSDFLYDIRNIELLVKEHNQYINRRSSSSSDIYIREIQPPAMVTSIWGTFLKENITQYKLYLRTTPELYKSKYFRKTTTSKYTKSCGARDTNGEFISSRENTGQILHPDHIRCYHTDAIKASIEGVKHPYEVSHQSRMLHRYPFLVHAKNAIVSRSGMIVQPCGLFGLFAQCEASLWGVTTAQKIPEMSVRQRDLCFKSNGTKCPYRVYKKVFIMTQYDDTQIGQFHLEALPKLIYHLDFLYRNPEVYIHYGFSKRPVLPSWVLPNNYLLALNVSHRLINGTVMAEEVFMPREGGCQEPSYNAWELLHQREYFLNQLLSHNRVSASVIQASIGDNKHMWSSYNMNHTTSKTNTQIHTNANQPQQRQRQRRTVLLVKRTNGNFIQNFADKHVRFWPKSDFKDLLHQLSVVFKHHDLVVFSDENSTLMTCPLCQVEMFAQADVAIGIHGAGLANILYMKKGSFVVEVVPKYMDSRHLPIVGIFPRLAAVVGLHHYLYYVPEIKYDMAKVVRDIYTNIQDVLMLSPIV